MNILSNIKNFFSIFLTLGFVSVRHASIHVANVGHVEAKTNFCFSNHLNAAHPQSSFNSQSLNFRVNSNPANASHYSNVNPFIKNNNFSGNENPQFAPSFNRFQAQGTLEQSLQLQIVQTQNENNNLLSKISMRRSDATFSRPICNLSSFISKENSEKHEELTKLNVRLHNISNFCNEEMIEVLKLVSEACVNLEGKLVSLRKETVGLKDDLQLFENIEHIGHLEKILDSLHQLETKFQGMQKEIYAKQQFQAPLPNAQEAKVSSLLEQVEKLNREKKLLEVSQQRLPGHAAYDSRELQELIKISESEREEIVKKLNVSRHKYNLAKQFGSELTNHLIDYAEMFKDFIPKLRTKVSLASTDLSGLKAKKENEVKPLLSVACNNMSHAKREAKVQVSNEDGSDSNEFRFAASEVARALRQIMEVA